MKFSDVKKLAERKTGYVVSFDRPVAGGYLSDYFPEVGIGEPPFATETEAWEWAKRFAAIDGVYAVNIHVSNAVTFKRVGERTLNSEAETRARWPV